MEREEIQGTEFVYSEVEEPVEQLPQQEEFWRPLVRFGTVPVEKEPLGWDRHKGFRKLFPTVRLPFQIVERVSFGNPGLEPNRYRLQVPLGRGLSRGVPSSGRQGGVTACGLAS